MFFFENQRFEIFTSFEVRFETGRFATRRFEYLVFCKPYFL
jgi:hypothetical protein